MTSSTRRSPTVDLADYGRRLDDFVAELGAEYHAGLSGQTDAMALAPVYERHAGLFDRAAVDALARAADGSGEDARQARRLWRSALESHVQRAVSGLTDRIAAAEASAAVMWEGERIPYRSVPIRVAELSRRGERNVLDASYREALGFDDLVALANAINGFDAADLAGQLQGFIAASETVYFAALRRFLAEVDIEAGDASSADLAYLLRGANWDGWFEPRRLLPVVAETLHGLGIDIAEQPNVHLDLEPRPNKSARAFCVPVRIPDDVRLVMLPRGGHADYGTALHEMGHVEHFALTDPALPAADRHVGDTSISEGYAFLFQHLLSEPAWLAQQLGMPDKEIAAFADFGAFRRLFMLRRYAAKLLYELRMLPDPDAAIGRATYAGMLGLLTGVHIPEASWLADLDHHLYAGRYLRAWLLEGSLAAALRSAHGPSWWTDRAAGEQLRGLWRAGQRPTAEDVLAQLGYDQLDWRPILQHVRTHLIGELSGYGGPNITTRAGTRKV